MVKVGVIRKSFSKFVSFGPKFCSISSNLACLLFQCITSQIFTSAEFHQRSKTLSHLNQSTNQLSTFNEIILTYHSHSQLCTYLDVYRYFEKIFRSFLISPCPPANPFDFSSLPQEGRQISDPICVNLTAM